MPLAALSAVDLVCTDVPPQLLSRPEKCRITTELICIEKSHNTLSFHPPDTLFVDASCRIFIIQRTLFQGAGLNFSGDPDGNLRKRRCICFILQHVTGTGQKPACLNVVTVGINIPDFIPLSVKEHPQCAPLRIIDPVPGQIQQPPQPLCHLLPSGHPVKLRISFHQMQHRVHGLHSRQSVFGKRLIVRRLPVPGKCLPVAVGIRCFLLNGVEQLLCKLQGGHIPARPVIGAQPIYAERLIICMLDGVTGLPLCRD